MVAATVLEGLGSGAFMAAVPVTVVSENTVPRLPYSRQPPGGGRHDLVFGVPCEQNIRSGATAAPLRTTVFRRGTDGLRSIARRGSRTGTGESLPGVDGFRSPPPSLFADYAQPEISVPPHVAKGLPTGAPPELVAGAKLNRNLLIALRVW